MAGGHLCNKAYKTIHALSSRVAQNGIYPEKTNLNKLLSVSSRVKNSLNWWADPHKRCTGVPFTQSTLSLTMDGIPNGMGSPLGHRYLHHSGQMVPSRIHTTYQLTRAQSSQECMTLFLPMIKGKRKDYDRQHCMHVLYKLPRRSKITFPMCQGSENMELMHLLPDQYLSNFMS